MAARFYAFLIWTYKMVTCMATPFSEKASRRINGLGKQGLELPVSSHNNAAVLMHCSSLGEYEQGRPVIDWILAHTPYDVAVSFFSPSGFDYVDFSEEDRLKKYYLPFDLSADMTAFLDTIEPVAVIIVKNEWWWCMLSSLQKRKIPTYQISVTIRPSHYFIKYPLKYFRKLLNGIDHIFTVNESSKNALQYVYDGPCTAAGDTRADQVRAIKASRNIEHPTRPTIIYGSIWPQDLPIISEMIARWHTYRHLIYPHNLSAENIDHIQRYLQPMTDEVKHAHRHDIKIIHTMGQLKYDYHMADIAYVGGGFGDGVHNILEACIYGIPVIIGPRHRKSEEAMELIQKELVFAISGPDSIQKLRIDLMNETKRTTIRNGLRTYFHTEASATEIICKTIFGTQN